MSKGNQDHRLANFRQIIKSVGGTNEAARIMGKKNSYITQIAYQESITGLVPVFFD